MTPDEARLEELLEEATIDCYDEEEAFSGVFCTLEDHLDFPLQAEILGSQVEVLGLDGELSGLRRGIVAQVRKDNQLHTVNLVDLTFVDLDPEGAEWVAMARWWHQQ